MTKQIFKVMAAGILAGIALFLMPFMLIGILAVFLIIRILLGLVGGGRHHRRRRAWRIHFYPALARAGSK